MASSNNARTFFATGGDGPEPSCLHMEQRLRSSDTVLRSRFGQFYEEYLEQSRTAILMTMVARDIDSPFIAAVQLGASGDLARLMGGEDIAFAVLIQAALQVHAKSGLELAT